MVLGFHVWFFEKPVSGVEVTICEIVCGFFTLTHPIYTFTKMFFYGIAGLLLAPLYLKGAYQTSKKLDINYNNVIKWLRSPTAYGDEKDYYH